MLVSLMKIELFLKKFFYSIFRIVFRNKEKDIPIAKEGVRNILILRYDAIGDMIVTLPVIKLLNQLIPNSNIDVIASNRNASFIKTETLIRNKIIQPISFFKSLIQASKLKKNNYDLILHHNIHFQSLVIYF